MWLFNKTHWIFVFGEGRVNASGQYGIQLSLSNANVPGGRKASASWIDSLDNLWLFGGYGIDSTGALGTKILEIISNNF